MINMYTILGALGLAVAGYVKYLQMKNRGLQANALTSETKTADAALAQKQKDEQQAISDLDKKAEEVKNDSTPADANYWNKKLGDK